jgi:uncharacterized protein
MLLDLSKMRGDDEHVVRRYPASAFPVEGEAYRVVTEVTLPFDVHRDHARYRLVGRLDARLELCCSRCLEPFAFDVGEAFDLLYVPQSENAGEGEVEVEDEGLNVAFYRDDHIDLGQLMREQFYLLLPMKPLCSEACRGLCPVCGTNLNTGTCQCQPQAADARWDALRPLATRDGGD